jgi:hypothetical protein
MAAESLYLRSQTFTAGTAWLKTYADGLRDNDLRLGRTRYTSGEVALAQADAEVGALHVSSAKILRLYRQSGTGTSDDSTRAALSTPIRGVWHYDDNTGDPSGAASVEGDLYVRDAGSSDAWLESYDGSTYRGLGVLAEHRATATSGSPAKNSPRVSLRSQIWQGSTQTREWFLRSEDVNASGSFASFLSIRFQIQGSSDELEAWRISKSRAWVNGSDLCLDDMTLESKQTSVNLGSSVVDGFAGSIRLGGGYFGDAITRHNHIDVPNVQTTSGATVANSCVFRFPDAAGTHKALDSATGGAKWIKINEAGTVRYTPVLDSKEMPFPGGSAYADISTTDGAGSQTLTTAGTWYAINQWLTDGLAVNATPSAASSNITIVSAGDYMVSAIMSVQPDATETYIFRLVRLTGPSLIPTQLAETFVVSANGDVVAVGMNKPATLAAGDQVRVEVQNPTNNSTAIVLASGVLSIVRIG